MNWRFRQLLKCSIGKLERCVDLQSCIILVEDIYCYSEFHAPCSLLPDDCSARSMKLWVAINFFDQIIQLCKSIYIFIELVVLIHRNSSETLAYLISELVTCLDTVCFSLLVEETAINNGCRERQKPGEKSKIKFDKVVSPFLKKN